MDPVDPHGIEIFDEQMITTLAAGHAHFSSNSFHPKSTPRQDRARRSTKRRARSFKLSGVISMTPRYAGVKEGRIIAGYPVVVRFPERRPRNGRNLLAQGNHFVHRLLNSRRSSATLPLGASHQSSRRRIRQESRLERAIARFSAVWPPTVATAHPVSRAG